MKVREAIKLIEDDGWYLVRTRGSHRHFQTFDEARVVAIAGHAGVDIRKAR